MRQSKRSFNTLISAFLILITLALIPGQGELKAQSFAYKTLLNSLYEKEFPVIQPDSLLDLSRYQVLDTREQAEYGISHLNDAIWVGYDSLNLEAIQKLDKDKPVLVYCTVGARSQEIGFKLVDMGFEDVSNLYGGIIHWVNEGKPVYHEGSQTDQVHTYSMTWGIWLNKGEKVYD